MPLAFTAMPAGDLFDLGHQKPNGGGVTSMVISNDSGDESGHDIMAQWSSFTTKKGSVHSKINHVFTNKQSLVGALNQ